LNASHRSIAESAGQRRRWSRRSKKQQSKCPSGSEVHEGTRQGSDETAGSVEGENKASEELQVQTPIKDNIDSLGKQLLSPEKSSSNDAKFKTILPPISRRGLREDNGAWFKPFFFSSNSCFD
jgi:hypothetical protein